MGFVGTIPLPAPAVKVLEASCLDWSSWSPTRGFDTSGMELYECLMCIARGSREIARSIDLNRYNSDLQCIQVSVKADDLPCFKYDLRVNAYPLVR